MRSDKLLDGMVSVLRKLLKAGILIAAIQAIAIMPASSSPLLEQLQPVESWEPTPIKRGEFRANFHEKYSLALEDLDVFPDAIRRHLGIDDNWHKDEFSGFSKEIRSWIFLVVVTDKTGDYFSKAMLLNLRSGQKSALEFENWKSLYLPKLKQLDQGWTVVVHDYHGWLKWNEKSNVLQNFHCTDIANYACIRHSFKIGWSQQELTRVEIDLERKFLDWKPIWDSGQWLIDPNSADFDTR